MAVVNRFSQRQKYATFNPMSMQELMVVPQFRQQQHDQAVAQAEALKTQENVLGVDQEQFDMQAGEINKGISTIVDDLSEKGLQTNTLANVRSLKNKRDTFLGAEGFGGKAMSNYALYQKALEDIDEMRKSGDYLNKDLNDSLSLAMKNYIDLGGAAAGGSFAYQSPEQYIDVQTKLNDLLKDVPISEQERDLGLTPIGPNKYGQMVYKHGSQIIEARSYEHQKLLAKQYLANDPEVMSYMKMQANFAENLHAVKENGTNKIIYDGKTYDADTFQTDFIMSKIENFARIGAEATDVYNVKTKLDYDIRNLSDAWLKAEQEANQRNNLPVYSTGVTENTIVGNPEFDDKLSSAMATFQFVNVGDRKQLTESKYISKGEGYIPAGLSLNGYKEFLKENYGYESPTWLETFTNFSNYKLAGSKFKVSHATRVQFPEDTPKSIDLKIDYDPQYEPATYTELPDAPQNFEDFYIRWQENMPEKYTSQSKEEVRDVYTRMLSGKGLFQNIDPGGLGGADDIRAGRAMQQSTLAKDMQTYMNLGAQKISAEQLDAQRWLHNTYLNNARDAFIKANPNADEETFRESHVKNLEASRQTEVLTTTVEGKTAVNNRIYDFAENKDIGGLQNVVFTAWEETGGKREVKKTKGKNTLEGKDKGDFLKMLQTGKFTVSNPEQVTYSGNPNEVGGYNMVVNWTNKDGGDPKTFTIRTYALSKGDQRRYQGMAMANKEWLSDNKVTTPSAVSKENLVAYDESVVTTVKDGRYFDQYNREMTELGAAVETGLIDGSGLEPNTRIISRYSAFNTYMPGADGIVNQGMRRLYKVKKDASGREVEVPLIDPDKYDEAIYNMDTENPAQNFIRGQMMFSTQGLIKRIRDIDEIYEYEAMRYPSSAEMRNLEPRR